MKYFSDVLLTSGGARDFFLQVLWGCSAFYRWCYEIRVIAYVSHGSLLQHLPTISSYLFTCLLSEAPLWSMKSAIQIDRIIIIIRSETHQHADTSKTPWQSAAGKTFAGSPG